MLPAQKYININCMFLFLNLKLRRMLLHACLRLAVAVKTPGKRDSERYTESEIRSAGDATATVAKRNKGVMG